MKAYWENRPEKTIKERYGHHEITVRYMANSHTAQVSIYDISAFKFPLIWSAPMEDKQANAALEIFKNVGYFDYFETV